MEALVIFSDILIVTTFAFYLIKVLFGDNPLGRILAVLGAVVTFFTSADIFVWANSGYLNDKIALIILFGPIAIFLLLMLMAYAFDGNTSTKNQERNVDNVKKSEKIGSKLEKSKDNSCLDEQEIIRYKSDIFNLRKNIFMGETGKLKLTDRNIIWYNHKKNIKIPIEDIKCIKSKNYFIFIPTGIQIKTSNKKYDFITMNRKDILQNINLYIA
jgi:hypothetical protein